MSHQLSFTIYAPNQIQMAHQIVGMIQKELPTGTIRICTKPEHVRSEMHPVASNSGITILLSAKLRDLNQIMTMADWFEDMPVILTVPNNRPETIAKAHMLRPRYLIVKRINWDEFKIVLKHLHANAAMDSPCSYVTEPYRVILRNDRYRYLTLPEGPIKILRGIKNLRFGS